MSNILPAPIYTTKYGQAYLGDSLHLLNSLASNSVSNSQYLRCCKEFNVKVHPARFPQRLPSFFINFLTEPGDLVVDIFSGSNTTGHAAE